MKRLFKQPLVAAMLATTLIVAPISVSTALLQGCAAVAAGQDPIVVNAERTTKNAWDLIDGFLTYEAANRRALWRTDQSIKAIADKLRDEAPRAFEAARNATKAYRQNKTSENKANLNTLLAVINQLLADAATASSKAVKATQ